MSILQESQEEIVKESVTFPTPYPSCIRTNPNAAIYLFGARQSHPGKVIQGLVDLRGRLSKYRFIYQAQPASMPLGTCCFFFPM
ncbi:uncharacterized protein N7500_002678 [Penicillium coprophilum]|uniref:uncharacterized protein n=1 Tax=Penicillium coprophilum TaxID=36646 RepID=UPI0023A52559|nr:uncharacterized protein N7500_002678 [Penicillium coprophilum]KAJ5169895.1 hypothetical protein N7500_002678 [Penicillium coprophilum]